MRAPAWISLPPELVPLPLIRDAGLPRGTHFFGQGCLTCCAPVIPYLPVETETLPFLWILQYTHSPNRASSELFSNWSITQKFSSCSASGFARDCHAQKDWKNTSFIDNYSTGQHYFHAAKAWKSLFAIPSTFSNTVAENLIILSVCIPIQHYYSLFFCLLRWLLYQDYYNKSNSKTSSGNRSTALPPSAS